MLDALNEIKEYLERPKCKKWFEDHGAKGENHIINCACWAGGISIPFFPELFFPANNIFAGLSLNIIVSNAVCEDYNKNWWKDILVHELAHTYCIKIPGYEGCANEAERICSED